MFRNSDQVTGYWWEVLQDLCKARTERLGIQQVIVLKSELDWIRSGAHKYMVKR